MPQAVAVVETQARKWLVRSTGKRQYRAVSFEWLDADSSAIAAGLREFGVEPGMRIALLVRPGIDFVSLVFALLKAGVVQVLIDPGMGLRNTVRALDEVRPQGFIAAPKAQAVRRLWRRRFSDAKFNIAVGRRSVGGGPTLDVIRQRGFAILQSESSDVWKAETTSESLAAIIFTSGSTGPAKGVLYRHGNFDQQVTEIRDFYGIQPGEIDVACFPLFGLFNAAMGVTSVFPEMDFSRPARVDPRSIIAAVNDWQATQAFGSPAVWNVVGRYCQPHELQLPSLRRVLSAGAPVAAKVLERMKACIHPDGDMHTPYGATESLPVASITATEVLGETARQTEQGLGVCVGNRFPGIQWKVIGISDWPIEHLGDAKELPRGEIGELIVRGAVVTAEYVSRPEANAKAKIRDRGESLNGDADCGSFWHRMGDVGYLDAHDRFWFCGRMSQRVTAAKGPMFTIPCEAVFNRHPHVFRSALVGIGRPGSQRPAIVVEPHADCMPGGKLQREQLIAELLRIGESEEHTAQIKDILLLKSLPVDVRHNVKINREQLAVWAARQLGARQP
jgi:acyl-CoA synthetase (AMP-forming)/AMP-acid ligase II